MTCLHKKCARSLTTILVMISCSLCFSATELAWTTTLPKAYLAGNNHIHKLPDGSHIVGGYNSSYQWYTDILDANGVHKVHLEAGGSMIVMSSNPLVLGSESEKLIYVFNEDYSYSTTSLPSGDVCIAGLNTAMLVSYEVNTYYTLNNLTLRKYRFLPSGQDTSLNVVGVITAGISGDNFVIKWNSVSGKVYQPQFSNSLTNWVDIGLQLSGTGQEMQWANPVTNTSSFYRVIEQ